MLTDRRRKRRTKQEAPNIEKAGNLLPLPPISIVQGRVLDAAVSISTEPTEAICYMHSVMCQTSLPYRNPGDALRVWERKQGHVSMRLEAGAAMHPDNGEWIDIGLPYGPKARLLLCYLNTRAKLTSSPTIEVGDSLTDFVVKEMKLSNDGRTIRSVKDQTTRLAASHIRVGASVEGRAYNAQLNIVKSFDLWLSKDERQRVLWPSVVELSADYFENLMDKAVPLDLRAVSALSNSAMGLDIYMWLAQRLHRIEPRKGQLIPWVSLKEQFGPDVERMIDFRKDFLVSLRKVVTVYPAAKIDITGGGLLLYTSPPPIAKTGVLLSIPKKDTPKN